MSASPLLLIRSWTPDALRSISCDAPATGTRAAAVAPRRARRRSPRRIRPVSTSTAATFCLFLGIYERFTPNAAETSCKLVGEQRDRIETPGEVDVGGEVESRLADAREVAHLEDQLVEPPPERAPPLIGVELSRQRFHRAVVHPELARRVAAGREQEQ